MFVIICIDDNKGMMFNHRRQSQDKNLRNYILSEINNDKLWMNAYTYGQFSETQLQNIVVDEDFLKKAGQSEYCFVEDEDINPYLEKIEKIVLFKWNRKYPADFHFNVDINGWDLVKTEELRGNSHEKITKEIYEK
jgi:hypothetical protein